MSNQKEDLLALGRRISALRWEKGWTQAELARRIAATEKSIGRWERGEVRVGQAFIEPLKRELGLTSADFLTVYGEWGAPAEMGQEDYRMCGFAEAAKICGSFEALDIKFLEIEDSFYVPTEEGEYGDDKKWTQILKMSPETGECLVHKGEGVVGYWQCFLVSDLFYKKIVDGENVNKSISSDDIIIISEQGKFSIFFSSLFILTGHRSLSNNAMVFESIVDFMLKAARGGVFFKKIAANITGSEARNLCVRSGFRKVIDHPVHKYALADGAGPAEVFELIVGRDRSRFFNSDYSSSKELRRRYVREGLIE